MRRGKLSISNHSRLLAGKREIAWIDRDGGLRTVPGRYGDGSGLYLQLGERSASWIFRYQRKTGDHMLGLGPLRWVSIPGHPDPAKTRPNIHEMRAAAERALDQLRDGIDPIDEKKNKKKKDDLAAKVMTFREAAEAYHKLHAPKFKNAKHAKQVIQTLRTYAFPKIGSMNVADIDTPDVLRVLQPIWQTVPETASRVRGRVEGVLGWAIVNKYRPGPNPAQWRGLLENALPATSDIADAKNHAALPYSELPAFMSKLSEREATAARALELTILCATRTNETIGARWPEVDFENQIWTIPAERMKGKKNTRKEHRVPLSSPAVALLKKLHAMRDADDGFVFIGADQGKPMSNMAMLQLLDRMGFDITVHGFRSTFKDWVSECTSYPNIVSEMALAHVIESKVEAAYRRGDLLKKRAQLMTAWADYCYRPVGKGNVVPIKKGAAK